MNVDITHFEIKSYDDVYALWQQCEGVGLSEADARENITAYLTRNPGMSFVATSHDKIVGVVLAGHDGRRGYIHHLAVHPDHRRRHIASELMDCCLTALSGAGILKCHLFIFKNNRNGIAFWKAAGWTPRSDISVISKNID
ncbi:MAG: GNAT family N-acetyltransferase [Desulfobacteraceae bacterium]|nr:GNAT family N-acetyltransferase [Desulfobacteraceae bacterium]